MKQYFEDIIKYQNVKWSFEGETIVVSNSNDEKLYLFEATYLDSNWFKWVSTFDIVDYKTKNSVELNILEKIALAGMLKFRIVAIRNEYREQERKAKFEQNIKDMVNSANKAKKEAEDEMQEIADAADRRSANRVGQLNDTNSEAVTELHRRLTTRSETMEDVELNRRRAKRLEQLNDRGETMSDVRARLKEEADAELDRQTREYGHMGALRTRLREEAESELERQRLIMDEVQSRASTTDQERDRLLGMISESRMGRIRTVRE